jgi:hypothetical protein
MSMLWGNSLAFFPILLFKSSIVWTGSLKTVFLNEETGFVENTHESIHHCGVDV